MKENQICLALASLRRRQNDWRSKRHWTRSPTKEKLVLPRYNQEEFFGQRRFDQLSVGARRLDASSSHAALNTKFASNKYILQTNSLKEQHRPVSGIEGVTQEAITACSKSLGIALLPIVHLETPSSWLGMLLYQELEAHLERSLDFGGGHGLAPGAGIHTTSYEQPLENGSFQSGSRTW